MVDDVDPRDRDDDVRDIEMPWVELGRSPGSDREEDDPRDRADDIRDRDRDVRERDHDLRDVFLHDVELPRGPEREVVVDGDHRYELPESMVNATAPRNRSRPALGTERSVPSLLLGAAQEDEPPHARPAARGWQSAAGARR